MGCANGSNVCLNFKYFITSFCSVHFLLFKNDKSGQFFYSILIYSLMTTHAHKKLIRAAKKNVYSSLREAAETDSVTSFPTKTLAKIKKSKLFTASLSVKYGGQNLGLKPGTNLALLTILKLVGRGNLVVARVLEGHINALLLIDQYGTKQQKKEFAAEVFRGNLFGVWNTQAKDGTLLKKKKKGFYQLNGSKTFATGSDYVSRPIVTAAWPDGSWQMCIVPLDKVITKSEDNWWKPMGMRATRSYKINFLQSKLTEINLLGKRDSYYRQPAFSTGSVRFAAIQLGAAEMLLLETQRYLRSLNRINDPFQKMRVGKMAVAVESGNQWMERAAFYMDQYMIKPSKKNKENYLLFANMMRLAIEDICTEVIILCQKSVGARGLNKPYHFERIIRDLTTYLRQPAPDTSLDEVGKYMLQKAGTTISDIRQLKIKRPI